MVPDRGPGPSARRLSLRVTTTQFEGSRMREHDVPLTILKQCRRPALAPKTTAPQRDLDQHLTDHNLDPAHTGRPTKRRIPADIAYGAPKTRPPKTSANRGYIPGLGHPKAAAVLRCPAAIPASATERARPRGSPGPRL